MDEPPGALAGMPALHSRWLSELLPGPVPVETRATCASCAMVGPDALDPDATRFNPDTRCCTFMPDLPSFSVGALLADPDPALLRGQTAVRERVAAGLAVTPLGVGKSQSYRLMYGHANTFGRSGALRCRYLDGDRCGVWRYREATCATWFCRYERGLVGAAMWDHLRLLLQAMERELAAWAAGELGIAPEAIAILRAPRAEPEPDGDRPAPRPRGTYDDPLAFQDLDRRSNPSFYNGVWAEWAGRELEFYARAAELVMPLPARAALERCSAGTRGRLLGGARRAVAARLEAKPPPVVKVERLKLLASDGTTARLETYNLIDPLDVPVGLPRGLRAVDGKPLAEARELLAARGLGGDDGVVAGGPDPALPVGGGGRSPHLWIDALLTRLVDWGILATVGGEDE